VSTSATIRKCRCTPGSSAADAKIRRGHSRQDTCANSATATSSSRPFATTSTIHSADESSARAICSATSPVPDSASTAAMPMTFQRAPAASVAANGS